METANEKRDKLLTELTKLCLSNNIISTNQTIVIKNIKYYVSFGFKELGLTIAEILKKSVKSRTEQEHIKLIKHFGGAREYLLSMGKFKDE